MGGVAKGTTGVVAPAHLSYYPGARHDDETSVLTELLILRENQAESLPNREAEDMDAVDIVTDDTRGLQGEEAACAESKDILEAKPEKANVRKEKSVRGYIPHRRRTKGSQGSSFGHEGSAAKKEDGDISLLQQLKQSGAKNSFEELVNKLG